ncbi:ATP-binding cassette domain-containing protein [Jhaorihella thermophila]|uniref:ATP-binding cassette, subfamily C, LapB n=1 Tax=Jhaorihella thermophila TaxID=488547 RepID=A0A1H5U020_9RHOB|nr:ATP-binding cassette domain-containing protein [Jhaorihella thermophila]SEF68454.1 ATP-binding cassette, subfamily C, LapB [Jhaorihella thermophila]
MNRSVAGAAPARPAAPAAEDERLDPPLRLVRWFAAFHGRPFTAAAVLARLPAGANLARPDDLELALAALGLKTRSHRADLRRLDPAVPPCIAFRHKGSPVAVVSITPARGSVELFDPETGLTEHHPMRVFRRRIAPDLLLVAPEEDQRTRPGAPPAPTAAADRHWFWGPVRDNWRGWAQVVLATLLINLMALALPLFVMNVYDRVIPTFSTVTLWTLAIGVGLAIALDLLLRLLRAGLLERISRRVDLRAASALFRQALNLRLLDRQDGAASLASRIREYEAVRELFASTSFVAAVDLLFVGLFIGVLAIVVGPLAWVPLGAMAVILTLALLAQIPMARTADTAGDVAARRLNVLAEALGGVLTVKALNAEPVMQREWERAVAASARLNGRARVWANFVQSATLAVQQLTSIVIVAWGVYLVVDGTISVGALIAANILASRALAPLALIAQTVFRAQYARKSLGALDAIMQTPTESTQAVRSGLRVRRGEVSLRDVDFTWPGAATPALRGVSLDIPAGARVALLGRVGSGKSTLGKMLAGLIAPDTGTVLIDSHGASHYDPAELRAGIGYLPQSPEFFTGTLRENLLIGRPDATQDEIDRALYLSGLDDFVAAAPEGLALFIGDRGARLSGGQAQALSLARLLIRRPRLMFLDEPTNSMDQEMEARVCRRLDRDLGRDCGLILCTHRQPLAVIADRYAVLDAGRKVLDGPRAEVTAALSAAPAGGG